MIVSQEIGKEDPPESFIIGNKKSYQVLRFSRFPILNFVLHCLSEDDEDTRIQAIKACKV